VVGCLRVYTCEACVAPTALGILFVGFSHRFRGGLAYAAPTALVWSGGRATRCGRGSHAVRAGVDGAAGGREACVAPLFDPATGRVSG
jgi:hypothetical protein